LARIQPLIELLRQFGEAHGGKTPSQVALNWLMCKGALPIPGVHSLKHVQENAGAMGWRLSQEEVARLDSAEENLHRA
jgi:diketogulonate reductase-like aldo/keto reductase